MNNSIYRVCLDIHTTHSQVQLEASKGDNARLIEFTLTDGGAIYSVADDCTAIFRAQKPSGAVLFNSCTIAGDRIKYQMTNQTTAEVGILQCELEVIGADSKVLTAPRFTIRVADTVYSDDEVESEDEFTQLQTAIIQVGNVDIDCSKVGHTATVTITDKTGTQKSVNIYDGDAGQGGDVTITGDASDNLTSITAGEDTCYVSPVSATGDASDVLQSITVGNDTYTVPQGTEVSATADADDVLQTLTIGEDTYTVPQGSAVSATETSGYLRTLTIDGDTYYVPQNLVSIGSGYLTDGTVQVPFRWTLVYDKLFLAIAEASVTAFTSTSITFVFNNLLAKTTAVSRCDVSYYTVPTLVISYVFVGQIEMTLTQGDNSGTFKFKDDKLCSISGSSQSLNNATASDYNNLKGKTLCFDFPQS